MKNLYETFTDEEFEKLKEDKDKSKLNWHDYIIKLMEDKKK